MPAASRKSVISAEKMNVSHKNILIVFDAAGCAPLSMQTATELAAAMQAGLQALYIEDNNLLNAVELPFTREVSLHTAAVSHIDATLLLQRFRTDAESIKRQIEEIAVTRRVSFSFSSMRGHKTQVIKNRTAEANMVLIPAAYSGNAGKQEQYLKPEVVVVYETAGPASDKALDIALSYAGKKHHQLTVILGDAQSRRHVEELTGGYRGNTGYHVADLSRVEELVLFLNRHAPDLLVLMEGSALISDEKILQRLINSLECDLLLVS
jgi:hypothetical protein